MRVRALLVVALACLLLAPLAPADHPMTDGGRSLVFDHKTGNEWWVEVVVKGASAGQVAGVDARDTDGEWKALTLRSWGAWAGSFRIEPGHLVQFRARFADGAAMTSCWFTHPGGAEQCESPPQPGGDFAATFRPKPGNEWWVETSVDATAPLAKVQARVNGGAWTDLTLRSWGTWAKSFYVKSGSLVQFQAVSTTGETALSGEYRWPDATLVTPPPGGDGTQPWPREGSYVRFDSTDVDGSPIGADGLDATVTYRYQSGKWLRDCEGIAFEQYPGLAHEAEAYQAPRIEQSPPLAPADARVGQVVDGVPWLEGCGKRSLDNVTIVEEYRDVVYRGGQPMEVTVLVGEWESVPSYAYVEWEKATGVILRWRECSGPSSGCDYGRYEDSDAPMPGEARSESGWDRHGTFARYRVNSTNEDPDGSYAQWFELEVAYRYEYGEWEVTCDGRVAWWDGDTMRSGRYYDKWLTIPLAMPTGVTTGQRVDGSYLSPCGLWSMDVIVRGQFPEDTTRDGQTFRARAWWADEPDDVDAAGNDRDVWWDTTTGLVLRWERDESFYYGHFTSHGRLLDTNVPLGRY